MPAGNVTLWFAAPFHVQVTWPPAAMVAAVGSKELSSTETFACVGAGPVAVAVKVTGEPFAPALEA
jgi:hypothetical protein